MITLRPLVPGDQERLRTWRNQPDIARYMHTDHTIGPEEHARWFSRVLTDPDVLYRMIELDGAPVGLVYITPIDRRNRRCSWAFYLASPSVRGRGVGSFVEYWVLNEVFEVLGLERLCCEVLGFNQPVIDMHRSFGFTEEGRLRRHVLKADGFHDVVLLGMLRDEWRANRAAITARLRAKGHLPPESTERS